MSIRLACLGRTRGGDECAFSSSCGRWREEGGLGIGMVVSALTQVVLL
jgi:hypothetical protein